MITMRKFTMENVDYIREYITRYFLECGWDGQEATAIAHYLAIPVTKDVYETADLDKWHNGDIEVAIHRQLILNLKKKNYIK